MIVSRRLVGHTMREPVRSLAAEQLSKGRYHSQPMFSHYTTSLPSTIAIPPPVIRSTPTTTTPTPRTTATPMPPPMPIRRNMPARAPRTLLIVVRRSAPRSFDHLNPVDFTIVHVLLLISPLPAHQDLVPEALLLLRLPLLSSFRHRSVIVH